MRTFNAREHKSSILVAVLSSAFGVALLQLTTNIATAVAVATPYDDGGTQAAIFAALASVFIVISVYVGAVVTANTFATIIAGRTRSIALVRLIGGSARSQRLQVVREGFAVGTLGAIGGAVIGVFVAFAIFQFTQTPDGLPIIEYSFLDPVAFAPIIAVVLTTGAASWLGSRRVLDVTPLQALGASIDSAQDSETPRVARAVVSTLMVGAGIGIVVLGMIVGLAGPEGVLISLLGGVISFTGFLVGAQFVMPAVLRIIGQLIGRGAAGALAAKNAVRYPKRSTRITVGLVIGITLVTMFAVAAESFASMMRTIPGEGNTAEAEQALAVATATFSILIGFSAIIAGVGLVNNLSLSIVQRTRELGLLRALGFTGAQLRAMIRSESAQLTIAANVVGLTLGIFYGWAGAQALLGSVTGQPGFIPPVVPWWILAAVIVSSAALALIASVEPSRRVTTISPVEALAIE
ncbi:ABC transporter permease [Salinibacterium sp. M195]|uniref:ABC transporter permease n=1 Tax=Salinibacterium sp. M195 TaxID=2583374 RepID=UPI001C62C2D8|nr:ABC transporter permease [Salinibacterium sp. M195]QYH35955.1 ABC transporter permease [Salinibacterium sp. M195]